MVSQLDLNLSDKKKRKKNAPRLARMMMAICAARGGWVTRREIMQAYGWKDSRMCRLGREGSHGRILFSDKGFKLARTATLEDWLKYIGRMAHERDEATRRYMQATRRFHRMGR